MAGITVKNVVITGNKIAFTLPKGNVLSKIAGTFSMPQSFRYTLSITPEAESSNGFWFPITRDFNLPEGQRPVANGGNQISHARIYAKVGKIIGQNNQGHNLFSISKLGFAALNINKYIEDFECDDGTLETAMSKLVGENLGNGTGIIKLKESSEDSGASGNSGAAKSSGTTGKSGAAKSQAQQVVVPGMPSDFGRNPENVKIAQRYLVANHANISTTKSVDGVDGMLGPRTKRAILAYMTQHNCDFAKFWEDAQEYSRAAQNVEDLKKQNMKTQMNQITNLKLNTPNMTYQQQEPSEAQPQGAVQQTQPQSAEQPANKDAQGAVQQTQPQSVEQPANKAAQGGQPQQANQASAQQSQESPLASVDARGQQVNNAMSQIRNTLDTYAQSNPDEAQRVTDIKTLLSYNDYDNALKRSRELPKDVRRNVEPLIKSLRKSYKALGGQKPAEVVNENKHVETIDEVRNKFYDIFNRMNNATILQ